MARAPSSLRAEQTALSRSRILAAARSLFLERGYLGTTLGAVASEAGVSVQTVYNVVGGKALLLKGVYDVTLTGDDNPVPIAERASVRAILDAPTGRECLARYAAVGRVISERTVVLITMLLGQAATGDPELSAFAETIETERATGTATIARHVAKRFGLRPELDEQAAADVLWVLTAPELASRLVRSRGWEWDRYERWLSMSMNDALLGLDG